MGCLSFMCKEANRGVESTSFDGDDVYLFLLHDGKVIEEMHGNYDSYGRVFDGEGGSFEWKTDWGIVCELMFSTSDGNGIAAILASEYKGLSPTTQSDSDPNQGWGSEGQLIGDCSTGGYPQVEHPYHKVYEDLPYVKITPPVPESSVSDVRKDIFKMVMVNVRELYEGGNLPDMSATQFEEIMDKLLEDYEGSRRT